MMFNTTFSNISTILWRSVLLLEETTDLSSIVHWTTIGQVSELEVASLWIILSKVFNRQVLSYCPGVKYRTPLFM